MAAMVTGLPELTISDTEAAGLADAVTLVGKEYGVVISGKTAVSLNLLLTAAMIYAPKAYLIHQRTKATGVQVKAVAPAAPLAPMDIGKPEWSNG